MPELPEVETTCRGIEPHIVGHTIEQVILRRKDLRWPMPECLLALDGEKVERVDRRGKYILIKVQSGTIIMHLGMSGSLRILSNSVAPKKHDHVDVIFKEQTLRLHDPRRFGAVLFAQNPLDHKLLKNLGPEPLTSEFDADYLFKLSRNRKVNIKSFVMSSQVVVGVGNIYACESLFLAGISPKATAGKVSKVRYAKLVDAIKQVLAFAIKQGGTTLKDFVQAEGSPGYFQQQLNVYGREGEPCIACGTAIKKITQGQRSTFYCSSCQK